MQLSPGTVHLCLCEVDVVEDWTSCRHLLCADELLRCERFPEEHRTEAILTRALLRASLSRYSSVDPADWRFAAAEHGKPYIASPASELKFNLSHSGGRVVCAISQDMELGVDLQICDSQRNVERLARRYFSGEETAALEVCEGSAQLELFYDLWALKEARTKAAGGAIAAGLGKYRFDLPEPGVITSSSGDASYFLWDSGPQHRLALCVLSRSLAAADVQVFGWQPEAGYEAHRLPLRAVGGLVAPA